MTFRRFNRMISHGFAVAARVIALREISDEEINTEEVVKSGVRDNMSSHDTEAHRSNILTPIIDRQLLEFVLPVKSDGRGKLQTAQWDILPAL
jgi:hypothetical protein